MMPRPTAIDAAQSFRRRLASQEIESAERMATAYNRIYVGLQDDISKLADSIAGMETPNKEDIIALARMRAIQAQVREQVARFGGSIVTNEIATVQGRAIEAGIADALKLMEVSLPPLPDDVRRQITGSFARLPVDAVEAAAGLTGKDSPLNARLEELFGDYVAGQIENHIIDGIAKGQNPREIDRILQRNVRDSMGNGLTSVLSTIRTAQIKSYQIGAHSSYLANNNIVKGWVWHAELGSACFPAGTLITTKRGNVPIETVISGDFVLTHTGKWQKVTNVMRRSYSGEMVTMESRGVKLTATKDHPLLVERQGQLNWIEISRLRIGDRPICDVENLPEIVNHFCGGVSVKWSIGNPKDRVTSGLKPECFSGVPIFNGFLAVPIDAVYLNNGINTRQKEVNGVFPARKGMLLKIFNAHIFKTKPDILFWFGFARKSTIASWGAKLIDLCGLSKKFFTTGEARDNLFGFVSTLFRAMVDVNSGNAINLIANWANFKDFLSCDTTLRAKSSPSRFNIGGVFIKNLSTSFTGALYFCGALFKKLSSTFLTTVHSFSISVAVLNPGIATANSTGALYFSPLTGNRTKLKLFNHSSIIPDLSILDKCLNDVYNLEVEEDHSYFANGFAVHNCLSCTAQHGTIHDLSEVLSDHHAGRCSPLPQTITYADLGLDIPEIVEPIESGEDWFNRQSAATQREMMGPGMYSAWQDKQFKFGELSRKYNDPVYGELLREASLTDLLGDKAKEYYK